MSESGGSPSTRMKIQYVKNLPSGETGSREVQRRGLTRFEMAIGGRERLIEALESADLDARQEKLLHALADPENRHLSVGGLARMVGMKPHEVLNLFRSAQTAEAFVVAHAVMAEKLPSVVSDVAEKSVDHLEKCPCVYAADGSELPALPDCPRCSGKGVLHYRSSLKHQSLLLEAVGLLKKGGGVNVQVQQNTGISMGAGFFDKFVKATDRAALDVIDAEEVES